MTLFDLEVADKVKRLINGEDVNIPTDEVKIAVQKRLREIKNNCTVVLKQLKDL